MTDQIDARAWTKANAGKWFKRGNSKRSYRVVRHETRRLGGRQASLIHVVNDQGLTGVIGYSDMKEMSEVGTEPK